MTSDQLKSVGKDTLRQIQEAELTLTASSLAYTTLLSMIPLMAVSFSIFKAFGGLDKLYGMIEPFIFENLAEGSDEKTLDTIRSFIGNIHAGALGIGGFLGLIVTSMATLSSIERSINRVWKIQTRRALFHRVATYWFFITLGPLALALLVGGATSLGVSSASDGAAVAIPSGWLFVPILFGIFFGMYKWIPHRNVHVRPALVAAAATTLIWTVAKLIYSFYVTHVVKYAKVYGALGAIPILLIWIYVGWLVVLAGAALSAALQKRLEPK